MLPAPDAARVAVAHSDQRAFGVGASVRGRDGFAQTLAQPALALDVLERGEAFALVAQGTLQVGCPAGQSDLGESLFALRVVCEA